MRGRGAERIVCAIEPGFDWGLFEGAVNSLSLFSPWRFIEVELGGALPGGEGGRAIVAYAKDPPADTVVLIRSRRLDAQARQSAWFRAVDTAGLVVEVSPVPADKLPQWLVRRMERSGFRLAREAAAFIAERAENNLVAASQELEKLQLLATTREITLAEAVAICSDGSRYDVFGLVDRVLEGHLLASLRAVRGLRQEGVEPPLILWALSRDLRTLCRVASRVEHGQPLDAALRALGVWERRRSMVGRAVQRHGTRSLRALLLVAGRVDRVIKGVLPGDPWVALERLCAGLAGPARAVPPGR
jgi:DNA polymerase-3 subunit delta